MLLSKECTDKPQHPRADLLFLIEAAHKEVLKLTGIEERGPDVAPIGEVIGHKEIGLSLVQWTDSGLRPIGTKLYSAAQVHEMQAVWNMLLLDGNCSDPSLTGVAKLRRIIDDLIEKNKLAST